MCEQMGIVDKMTAGADREHERGASMVEASFALPLFFVIVFGIIQVSLWGVGLIGGDLAVAEVQADLNDSLSVNDVVALFDNDFRLPARGITTPQEFTVTGFPNGEQLKLLHNGASWVSSSNVTLPVVCTGYLELEVRYEFSVPALVFPGIDDLEKSASALASC